MSESADLPIEYDDAVVARLELIWGDGFLSPGGAEEVREMLRGVPIADRQVLDIGCGTGAIDVLLVREHAARHVLGLDVEQPLLDRAQTLADDEGLSDQLTFQHVRPGPLPLDADSWDIVFSKDAILQIPDKPAFLAEVFRVLKPGGHLVASDWLKSPAEQTPALDGYRQASHYEAEMAAPAQMQQWLEAAGFVSVTLRDRTDWLCDDARRTNERITGVLRERAISLIGQEKYDRWVYISTNWETALAAHELRPTHLLARKPG
jgi:phosphoethanolamine N-methyltransferase